MSRPIIIAHRGGLEHAPENTLEAFAAAIAGDADGLELDLQLTDDGQLVVRHDALTAETDLAALPRLADVLALIADGRPDMRIVVDIKGAPWNADGPERSRALIAAASALLRAHPRPDRIVLGSFDYDALLHARQALPDFATAFHTLAARWLAGLSESQTSIRDPKDYLAWLEAWRQAHGPGFEGRSHLDLFARAGGTIWSCHHRDLTDEAVLRARALGLAVWTWTVNTEADLARVLALGVDAITTDRPDHLLQLINAQAPEISNA